MRILLVSATVAEVAGLPPIAGLSTRHRVELLTTGVGMVATAARCAQTLTSRRYDLALNIGLCGSFDPELELGRVVHVVRDRMSELGAEDGGRFLTLDQLGLAGGTDAAPLAGELVNTNPPSSSALETLPVVGGITVNTVHGEARSIADVVTRFAPQVESMEGAAFMYACMLSGVRFAQVRAVSNRVEERDRSAWNIPDALARLTSTVRAIVDTL